MADDPEISFLVTIKFGEEQSFTDDLDEAKERAAEAVRLCIQEDVGDRAQVNVSALPDPHPRGADMTDLSAEELVRDAIQKLHRKIEALRPRHPCAEGEAMTDDPEITDPRDPYKRRDIVAELDRYLDEPAFVDRPVYQLTSTLMQRARDEIVALRGYRDECERQFQEQVAATGRLFDRLWLARAEALEEAAQRCDRLATDYTIPVSADNWSAGCRGCAGRVRALKGQAR